MCLPVIVFSEPTFIGSVDNPTINGGHINAIEISRSQKINMSTNDNFVSQDKIKKILNNANREGKLEHVLNVTQKMGLPANLSLIPIIESNYRTDAVSAKGAAGAWQLMPSTARDYGVSSDERFQLSKSTPAALRYLRDLHNQFGNWDLTFAAYNAGSGRVMEALRKNPAAKSIEELRLPTETKNYVHRMARLNESLIELSKNV